MATRWAALRSQHEHTARLLQLPIHWCWRYSLRLLVVHSPHAHRQCTSSVPSSWLLPSHPAQVDTKVLTFSEFDAAAGLTRWKLADVRANRNQAGKGRGLNRKQRDAVYELPLIAVRRVNLYLDF